MTASKQAMQNICWLHTRSEVFKQPDLIQVHVEILSRSVENMASHLLTKCITRSKSCQSLRSLESQNRSTCTWLLFPIGQVCSQVWFNPYSAPNFGFSELRTFPWSPSKVVSRYIIPLHTQSRLQAHLHYTLKALV